MADKFSGRGISKAWRFLKKTDWLPESEIINIQNAKLKLLIEHCYNNVPYYTKLFDKLNLKPSDIQSREDLSKLPILTKQIIRDNYSDLVSLDNHKRKINHCSTGGSTGTPLQFITDISTWNIAWASSFRAWGWYDFNLGEKIFTFAGNSLVKSTKSKKITSKDIFDRYIMNNYKYSCIDIKDELLLESYKSLVKLKPHAIRGYASSLVILADYIEKNNLKVPKVKVILTTGEKLLPEYRCKLQKVFKAPLFDSYGAGDGGIASHECYMHEGLHIAEERCVIEITDKEGKVLLDGNFGFVTTTDLDNFAFPFIRYHVGDISCIKTEKCSCGKSSRLFGEVLGREGKLVYTKSGIPLSPTILPIMLYRNNDYHKVEHQVVYNKIDKFQIRQDDKGDIKILLKLKDNSEDKGQFDYIKDNYKKHFVDTGVEMEFVENIPLMPSGKEDYCVSEFKYNNK